MKKYILIFVTAILIGVLVWATQRRAPVERRQLLLMHDMTTPLQEPPPNGDPNMTGKSESAADEAVEEPGEGQLNTESYKKIIDNVFRSPMKSPLSTFSIDVDRAAYSNVRRFLQVGQHPPADAVRVEEMINYFTYDYIEPVDGNPFSINTEVGACPWNKDHRFVHVGLQVRAIPTENLPASNLVFLIDVSGSMNDPYRLPLVKESFNMLVDQLRDRDHVGIVVYAGAAGVVLEPTSGAEKETIRNAIGRLEAGGSTAGGEGLRLAYQLARKSFKVGGNNRVIIATDGDFNVGESSDEAMEALIEEEREEGIFLTVLGYGMGNYKDSKLEILADKGNGNYAYIDNAPEARKILVNEFGGTLFTIAKDVKVQVEFDPARVQAYRLIGYENRALRDDDFNNDKKDAGELGSGHTVTALYEIIPVGTKSRYFDGDTVPHPGRTPRQSVFADEMMTVKLRYKTPDGHVSKVLAHPVSGRMKSYDETSENFRWACSVAGFGMLLRSSPYVNGFSYDQVIALAENSKGKDPDGHRTEFISLVQAYGTLSRR